MSSLLADTELIVEADGGSRGNPGPAGYGAVVRGTDGELLAERAAFIGRATNNVAEYRGLIAGMEAAAKINPRAHLTVRLDSKLVVEQMSGNWKIKHPDMRELALRAREIFPAERVTYQWIPRAQNAAADELANAAMDGGEGTEIARDYDRATEERAETARAERPVTVVLVCHPGPPPSVLAALGEKAWRDLPAPSAIIAAAPTTATAREIAAKLPLPTAARSLEPAWQDPDSVGEGLEAALENHAGDTVIVAAQADVIRAAVTRALGLSSRQRERVEVAAGSATILRYDGRGGGALIAFGIR